MEISLKKRESRFCNLKLFLIFLVIYGHLTEPWIYQSPVLLLLYRLIYSFHMPLFVFLSGYFIRSKRQALLQLKTALTLYPVLQAALVVLGPRLLHTTVTPAKPYWHLWYLLSLGMWSALAALWYLLVGRFRAPGHWVLRLSVLCLSIAGACLAGTLPDINRVFSLSRTIVFLPYFLLGLFAPRSTGCKYPRLCGLAALALALALIVLWGQAVPTGFLYHADGYQRFHLSALRGSALRLLCYAVGSCLSLFLLTWSPDRHFAFSKIGADTMKPYLLHAIPVRLFWKCTLSETAVGLLPVSAALLALLLIWLLYKPFQWHAPLYSLTQKQPRESA